MIGNALTIYRLRIFLTVSQNGSFNRAAQALLMSQAAVSQHIKRLENALGTSLFDRGPQGVELTEAGKLLEQHALTILRTVEDAEQALARFSQSPAKKLVVSATAGISIHILPPWLRQFQQIHPEVSLSLQTGLTHEVVQLVLEGQADFALIADGLNDISNPRLGRETLLQIDYLLVVPPSHPLAEVGSIEITALNTLPFLNRLPRSRTRRWLEQTLAKEGVSVKTVAELSSPDMVKSSILSGLGLSILPSYVVERDLNRGDLVEIKIEGIDLRRPLDLLWHNRKTMAGIHSSFAQLLRTESA